MPESHSPDLLKDLLRQYIEARRAQIIKLRATDDLPPPWIACPEIPCCSIGWRMGYGEQVLLDWYTWMKGLSRQRFVAYCANHRPPETWIERLSRMLSVVRSRITRKSRLPIGWPEWFEGARHRIADQLTPMSWDDYWDTKMKEFEDQYKA